MTRGLESSGRGSVSNFNGKGNIPVTKGVTVPETKKLSPMVMKEVEVPMTEVVVIPRWRGY